MYPELSFQNPCPITKYGAFCATLPYSIHVFVKFRIHGFIWIYFHAYMSSVYFKYEINTKILKYFCLDYYTSHILNYFSMELFLYTYSFSFCTYLNIKGKHIFLNQFQLKLRKRERDQENINTSKFCGILFKLFFFDKQLYGNATCNLDF